MNPIVPSEKDAGFRWLQSDHPELSFYNVPRHFPWPAEEADPINLTQEFRFHLAPATAKGEWRNMNR